MTADHIRNNIIDKLLTISNKEYLSALSQLLDKSSVSDDLVKLTEEQIIMLKMGEDDIKNGRVISHEELERLDAEWLKGLCLVRDSG